MSTTTDQAREAFRQQDVSASLKAHLMKANGNGTPSSSSIEANSGQQKKHVETHVVEGVEGLRCFVFGGLDGIVTIFCCLAASHGARLTPISILAVGLGNLLGDAVSMGVGEYSSAKSEQDFQQAELMREAWEMNHVPESEQKEMEDLYIEKYSFSRYDAQKMVEIQWRYKEYFLHNMLVEELGILLDDSDFTPLKRGAVMFAAFLSCGSVPLVTYAMLLWLMDETTRQWDFLFVSLICAATTYLMGYWKATFVGGTQSGVLSGLTMTANAALAGGVGYACGSVAGYYTT